MADTKVVASGAPARTTCAPLTNPLPLTVSATTPAGTDVGAMLVRTGIGFQSVTAPLAFAEELAALIARTVTVLFAGTTEGAVYMPDALIVPVAELPPVTPFTCHVTAMFEVPDTVALKVCAAPARTLALVGDTFTVTPDPDGGVFEPEELLVVPMQPASVAADRTTKSMPGECPKPNLCKRFINWRTNIARSKISPVRLCLTVESRETVRKDKIRRAIWAARTGMLNFYLVLLCGLRVLCIESIFSVLGTLSKRSAHRGARRHFV